MTLIRQASEAMSEALDAWHREDRNALDAAMVRLQTVASGLQPHLVNEPNLYPFEFVCPRCGVRHDPPQLPTDF